jgi:hypothetical protein
VSVLMLAIVLGFTMLYLRMQQEDRAGGARLTSR